MSHDTYHYFDEDNICCSSSSIAASRIEPKELNDLAESQEAALANVTWQHGAAWGSMRQHGAA